MWKGSEISLLKSWIHGHIIRAQSYVMHWWVVFFSFSFHFMFEIFDDTQIRMINNTLTNELCLPMSIKPGYFALLLLLFISLALRLYFDSVHFFFHFALSFLLHFPLMRDIRLACFARTVLHCRIYESSILQQQYKTVAIWFVVVVGFFFTAIFSAKVTK